MQVSRLGNIEKNPQVIQLFVYFTPTVLCPLGANMSWQHQVIDDVFKMIQDT